MVDDQNGEFFQLRGPWRAAVALALLFGFFAFPILLVLGLLAVAALTHHYDAGGGFRAAGAAVVVAVPIVLGLRTVLRPRFRPRGVAVGKKAQPQLWRMVEVLASAAHTRTPDEIRIVPEPTAQLHFDTALLGLRVRKCCLEIGLPLLAGLSVGELRAVVAGQLGHVAGGGLTVVAYRSRISVRRTNSALLGGPTKWLFSGYAWLFSAVTAPIERYVARSADAVAVRIAGKRIAMTALRKLPAIELGWDDYAEQYLSMAISAGHAPEVVLGFKAFMDSQRRKKELAERCKELIAQEQKVDGHPTLRARLELMKRLPNTDRKPDDRPAFAMLRDPKQSVPELEDQLLISGLKPRLQWQELARQAGALRVAEQAARLTSTVQHSGVETDPTIAGLLAAVHRGQGADLINPALDPGLPSEQVPQAVVDTLTELLSAAVVDALICAHRAHHELDWSGLSTVRLATGRLLDPDRLIRPAISDPRLIPGLHRALVDLGVPLQHARPPAAEPEPTMAGVASSVQYAGELHVVLVTDRGILLLPEPASSVRRLLAGVFHSARSAELAELEKLAATPVGKLRQHPAAQWVDNRDVATARLVQRRGGWSLGLELYLDDYAMSSVDPAGLRRGKDDTAAMRFRTTTDTEEIRDPCDALADLMGARLAPDDRHRAA